MIGGGYEFGFIEAACGIDLSCFNSELCWNSEHGPRKKTLPESDHYFFPREIESKCSLHLQEVLLLYTLT